MEIEEVNNELFRFGQNLAFLRNEKGWTQETIAGETGISQSLISAYENNEKRPTLERALKIALALDVSLGDMVDCDLENSTNKIRNMGAEEWKGIRRVNHPRPLRRFTHITLFMYYYSDTDKSKSIRKGTISLPGCYGEHGNFVLGEIVTDSQEYSCKLIIEHPKYVYIYGDNKQNPERMFIALHEPRYARRDEKYKGGIGIAISEGSSQGLYTQKVLLVNPEFITVVDEKHNKEISDMLYMDTPLNNGYTLTKDDDRKFYEWYKNNSKK